MHYARHAEQHSIVIPPDAIEMQSQDSYVHELWKRRPEINDEH